MMYMLLAFGCAGFGFILALNKKPIPALTLVVLAAMLFIGALTRQP